MRSIRRFGAALLAALSLTGCANRHPAALQGTWRLTDINNPQWARYLTAQKKKKYLATAATTLTLTQKGEANLAAKSFNLDLGLGRPITIAGTNETGTWEADGQTFKTNLSFQPGGQPTPANQEMPGVPYTLTNARTLKFSKEQIDLTWTKQ